MRTVVREGLPSGRKGGNALQSRQERLKTRKPRFYVLERIFYAL